MTRTGFFLLNIILLTVFITLNKVAGTSFDIGKLILFVIISVVTASVFVDLLSPPRRPRRFP